MQEMTLNFDRDIRIFENEHHDNCTVCGYSFAEGNTAHLGYLNDDKIAYICDGCSYLLEETIVRRYWMRREYIIPPNDSILWRYMDLSKYISLLCSKSLFFTMSSKFSDIYEGAKGVEKRKVEWDNYYLSFFKELIKNPPKGHICDKTECEVEKDANRLLKEINDSGVNLRDNTYVSCWHENEVESEAMWNLYSSNRNDAIAILTSYERLYNALDRDPSISIGRVNYIDYSKRFAPVNGSYWYKRKSFSHEKEVRAVLVDHKPTIDYGVYVPIDLNLLIQKVYVSPYSSAWFLDVVNDIHLKYKIKAPVIQSSLIETPFY